MNVFRVVKKQHANDLSGEGARLFGGRWNYTGTPCIYASTSRSLAILELTVNTSKENLPEDLIILTISIPDQLIHSINKKNLPQNWMKTPAPSNAKSFGTSLLNTMKYLAFLLPSAVVPEENNIIINPLHTDIKRVSIIDKQILRLYSRIKE